MTANKTWRLGNHYRIHVYDGDRPVATFHRGVDAAYCVRAVHALEIAEKVLRRIASAAPGDNVAALIALASEGLEQLRHSSNAR
jgi:hypothetical protein